MAANKLARKPATRDGGESRMTLSSAQQREILLEFVANLMLATKDRYLHCPPEEKQMALWQQDWMRLAERIGATAFRAALEEAWLKLKFFPLPAEIAEFVRLPGTTDWKEARDIKGALDLKRRFEAGDPDVMSMEQFEQSPEFKALLTKKSHA